MQTVKEKALELVEDGRCKIKRLVSEEPLFRKCLEDLGVAKSQAYFVLKLAAFQSDDYSDVETAMRIGPDAADAFDLVTQVFITSKQVAKLYSGHESTLQKIAEQFDNSLIDQVTRAVLFYYNEEARRDFHRNIASKQKEYTLQTEEDVAVLLFNCIGAAYDLDRKTRILDTPQSFSRVAVVSVSTFNMKGTVQHDTYKRFLRDIFGTLNCDLHHLQELLWKEDSNIWSRRIFPDDCDVDVKATKRKEGAAINNAGIALKRDRIEVVDKFEYTDRERLYCCRIQVTDTFQIHEEKRKRKISRIKKSSQYLRFLSSSYHGKSSIIDKFKEENIKGLIQAVKQWCEEEKLPAIIGGDFNYDIRKIRDFKDDPNIQIYCSESKHRPDTIDFLCTVHEDSYDTKMTLVPQFVRHLDIRKDIPDGSDLPQGFDPKRDLSLNNITNHLPIFGVVMIYGPSMPEEDLALELSTKLKLY